jgi:uncharacterized membrane protein (Fun14 family)
MSVISPVIYQLGIGGIGGFIAGYALKKLLKIVAVITGLFILALVYLSYKGILTLNYGELGNFIRGYRSHWASSSMDNAPNCKLAICRRFRISILLGIQNRLKRCEPAEHTTSIP